MAYNYDTGIYKDVVISCLVDIVFINYIIYYTHKHKDTKTMADLFDLELDSQFTSPQEELELYSCSLDSSTESLPDLQEVSTPLLYESRIPSRNNSINNEDVDQFHLDLVANAYIPKTIPELDDYKPKTTIIKSINEQQQQQDSSAAELSDIIKKGSISIQNNYKRWLLTSTHSGF